MAGYVASLHSLRALVSQIPTRPIHERTYGKQSSPFHGCLALALLVSGPVVRADEFFSKEIEPILKNRCYECHSHGQKIKGGLVLDSKAGWETGGDSGPALVPGKPEASLLIQAVSHVEKDLKMPPKNRLSAPEIERLTEWVRRGAPDPRSDTSRAADLSVDESWDTEFRKRLDWWSLKPMRETGPPAVGDPVWSREPVDRFIKARLEETGLTTAPRADEATLRRRLSFVLTGLPPLVHPVQGSYEAQVDALLASPHFGEHFARHWMDVVRYTDTYGYEWDNPAKGSHEYRDYLIRAFNDDTGFDQLVREQLAGDLLPQPRLHPDTQTNESLIGPMFYHLGEHRHGSSLMFNGIHQEMVNNKIDAFSKAFLATTVACARCHDHKLEAVSQRDYYALAALFTTPRWTTRVVDAPGKSDAAIARLKELRQAIREAVAETWRNRPIRPATEWREWAEQNRSLLESAKPGQIAYPVFRILEGAGFEALAKEWREAREAAIHHNAAFEPLPVTTFPPPGWVTEGAGFEHGLVEEAAPLLSLGGGAIFERFLPRGWHSHALSSKLPASLRTPPQHLVPGRFLSLKVAGGEFGGHLVVDDHAFQNETVAFYTNVAPEWKSFADAELKNGAQQVAIEICTSSLNPNFPPRTGLAKGLPNDDFGYDKRSWISITGMVTHETGGTPRDELDAFVGLYEGGSATDPWERLALWFDGAVQRWTTGKSRPGDHAILDWLLANGSLPNRIEAGSRIDQLVAEYRRVEAGIPFPRTANGMDERETSLAKYPLNVRGNVDVPGELIEPASLKMLHGEGIANRLALAESLVAPGHPLTARVYVNRVWQWVFGTGLVATPDDFGRLGDTPSHPELLDWLAVEFVREGWSTKKLVRRLVLSETFRQSGQATQAARERDSANRLLSFYPTRRLEAESIRDALLAISGRLDRRLFGRPVPPYRTAEDDKKRLFSGPVDGNGRRSLYLQMSIMDPPKFLTAFNLPDLKLPTGRRDVTNVPTQALVLLNDPFVTGLAKEWGQTLAGETSLSPEARIHKMFLDGFAREPGPGELARWQDALDAFGGDTPPGWENLAHAIFNAKEFIYYR